MIQILFVFSLDEICIARYIYFKLVVENFICNPRVGVMIDIFHALVNYHLVYQIKKHSYTLPFRNLAPL